MHRAFSLLLVLATPFVAHAQSLTDVPTGARVRVWLPETFRQWDGPAKRQLLRGYVERAEADTLRVTVPGTSGVLAVPRASIRKLEVSRGWPSRPASAVERAVSGAIGGAVTLAVLNDPRRSNWPHYRTDWRAAGVGAAWGGGIGAVVGFLLPTERWRRIRISR